MQTIELKDIRLAYEFDERAGKDAPVLVLSNSLGTSLAMWEPQREFLAATHRLLRYDTRGHGRSELGQGPHTLEQRAQDVLGLLDALKLDQVDFCGLSMGGMTAQWLGVHAPSRVRRIILCNTAAKIGTPETWNNRIATVLAEGMGAITEGVLERWFTAPFRATHPEAVEPVRQGLLETTPEGYAASCAAIRDADLRTELARIVAPTLVISGTHDPATTPADGAFLAAQIPKARYVELSCAHLSNVEQPREFNRALGEFLREDRHG